MLDSHRIAVLGSMLLTATAIVARPEPVTAAQPSFDVDVMAVLSKAGCNAGACHGNQNGKGGLRLSLRGQDSQFDYLAIVNELAGRRIDRFQPERSLLLLKPTAEIAHQGGQRFDAASPEYAILCQWIGSGARGPDSSSPRVERLEVSPAEEIVFAPQDAVQLQVTARFSDRTQRDVTRMAVYEPSDVAISISVDGLATAQTMGEFTIGVRYLDQQAPVRLAFLPARPNFRWSEPPEQNYVDRHIFAKLQRLRINPSPLCTDEVFVRRAYLDALGILPTAEEARQFVLSSVPQKRTQLIDRLLARPEFADHWALKWSDVLRNEEKVLDRTGVEVFYRWIRKNFSEGRPLSEFVRDLISAQGSTYLNPPANFHRANRDPTTRGEAVARVFLGTRLQCAKCHNHPFDRWTQDDYYAWAATFARIDYKIVDNKPLDKLDKNEFVGEQVVLVKEEGEVKNPNTQQNVAPRFLGEDVALPEGSDRLNELAAWLASPENTAFSRAQVNRIWYHLVGRGLVDPVDDFRDTNPPSHPALLDALAEDFVASGFHLRHLVRVIIPLSRAPDGTMVPSYG